MKIKILKIISIISFLFICSIDQMGLPIIIVIFIYLYQFINDIISSSNSVVIFWEGGWLTLLTIGTLITFWLCKTYKDKYLFLLCFLALLLSTTMFTGITNYYNYNRTTFPISFLLPIFIFITSSVSLLILNFKNPNKTK